MSGEHRLEVDPTVFVTALREAVKADPHVSIPTEKQAAEDARAAEDASEAGYVYDAALYSDDTPPCIGVDDSDNDSCVLVDLSPPPSDATRPVCERICAIGSSVRPDSYPTIAFTKLATPRKGDEYAGDWEKTIEYQGIPACERRSWGSLISRAMSGQLVLTVCVPRSEYLHKQGSHWIPYLSHQSIPVPTEEQFAARTLPGTISVTFLPNSQSILQRIAFEDGHDIGSIWEMDCIDQYGECDRSLTDGEGLRKFASEASFSSNHVGGESSVISQVSEEMAEIVLVNTPTGSSLGLLKARLEGPTCLTEAAASTLS